MIILPLYFLKLFSQSFSIVIFPLVFIVLCPIMLFSVSKFYLVMLIVEISSFQQIIQHLLKMEKLNQESQIYDLCNQILNFNCVQSHQLYATIDQSLATSTRGLPGLIEISRFGSFTANYHYTKIGQPSHNRGK